MIGLIELKQSYYMFARTPGARDKQKRKRRNFIAEGSALGAAYATGVNRELTKDLPDAEAVARLARKNATQAPKDFRAVKEGLDSRKADLKNYTEMDQLRPGNEHIKAAADRAKRDVSRYTSELPGLEANVGKTAKDAISREKALRNIKIGKRVSKYGAIGLAGLAGGELIRRGINKARQYEIRRK